jgi:serine phosphatase RsbU (regulator of sigma subunit)
LEVAAEENRAMFAEQRDVAETLQRSLMPRVLPVAGGLEIAGRYEAGVAGTEVGGDWYDVVPVSPTRFLFSVGDVSGRGLEAAATMASLRYSIRAYALDGSGPEEVLQKLTSVLSVSRSGLFATVVCGMLDTERGTLTVARAGHPDLLLIADDGSRYLDAPVGPAIGLVEGYAYERISTQLTPGTTALAFTDGLVERRGESLEVGLERLRQASRGPGPVDEVVSELVAQLAPDSTDDVAVLGLRWHGGVRGIATGTREVPVT